MEGSVEYLDNATLITPATDTPSISNYDAAKQKLGRPVGRAVEAHKHDYVSISGRKVMGTDRVILFRQCTCGREQAFDLLPADAARAIYLKLKSQETS